MNEIIINRVYPQYENTKLILMNKVCLDCSKEFRVIESEEIKTLAYCKECWNKREDFDN